MITPIIIGLCYGKRVDIVIGPGHEGSGLTTHRNQDKIETRPILNHV